MRVLLLAMLALLTVSAIAVAEDKPEAKPDSKTEAKSDYDWVFFYYMAYDNNLEGCGRPILNMLKEGVTSNRVAVVTFADFRDKNGMKRYEATTTGEKETQLEVESSAQESTLKEQLEWTRDNYKADKYVIVFLDHGGALSEMSYDENPGKGGTQNWLHAVKVANVITEWRKSLTGKLEFVFIQQCGKGTLENFHAFRDTAPYVMASQTVVGAPNYYYTKAITAVCEKPNVDGKEVSHLFQQHETDNMFTTYTTMNDTALKALPEKLDAVLKPLLELKEVTKPTILAEFKRRSEKAPDGAFCRMCFESGRDERMVDGIALLTALYEANELDKAPLDTFATWAKESLVTEHRVSPKRESHAGTWCGFSLYVPKTAEALKRYEDYPIYKETKLDDLMAKLVG
jgi:hypothetical protein